MLLRQAILNEILAGRVDTALRRWHRPSVKAGGRLRTAIGELAITAVDRITLNQITEADAKRAGFTDRKMAIADLMSQREGQLYRIRLRLAGPDPRIALRNREAISEDEYEELKQKLARLDAMGKQGPWTLKVMRLIASNEAVAAGDLAAKGGFEREWLKLNVRKLKNLGLTESLQPGYRLSPRGRAWLGQF